MLLGLLLPAIVLIPTPLSVPILAAVGFSGAGVVAGTAAAATQAGIGTVAAGSAFATAQSIAALAVGIVL